MLVSRLEKITVIAPLIKLDTLGAGGIVIRLSIGLCNETNVPGDVWAISRGLRR